MPVSLKNEKLQVWSMLDVSSVALLREEAKRRDRPLAYIVREVLERYAKELANPSKDQKQEKKRIAAA